MHDRMAGSDVVSDAFINVKPMKIIFVYPILYQTFEVLNLFRTEQNRTDHSERKKRTREQI